ncbi:MAG: acyl-CoA dehydrogenase family protein [Microbacterium sp.]
MRWSADATLDEYRAGFRRFLAEHSPGRKPHSGVRAPEAELIPAIRAFTAALYGAGYLGQTWPERFGGDPAHDPRKGFVVAEEIARARTWDQVGAGALAAGALIAFGSDALKEALLPRIRSGEDLWCQLFSEPGAGSDLAALSTRAVADGDDFVVTGQKVWTTNGHFADLGYLLARTDPTAPKHRGITAFALDMRTPGVDVRPLREITGTTDFNEVFLDGVRIRRDRVIGEVNDGWRVANASLVHERSSVAARGVDLQVQLQELFDLAASTRVDGVAAAEHPSYRRELGELAVQAHVLELMSKAVQSRIVAGTEDAADAPLVKVFFSELNLASTELGIALQGADGLLVEGDARAVTDGWWQDAFLYSRAYTIAGGANEVLRTVIAERALGLPREPRPA